MPCDEDAPLPSGTLCGHSCMQKCWTTAIRAMSWPRSSDAVDEPSRTPSTAGREAPGHIHDPVAYNAPKSIPSCVRLSISLRVLCPARRLSQIGKCLTIPKTLEMRLIRLAGHGCACILLLLWSVLRPCSNQGHWSSGNGHTDVCARFSVVRAASYACVRRYS
jgi:hypothetical protein